MKTVVEIDRAGNRLRVFHRTDTAAWEHPANDPHYRDTARGGAIVVRECRPCVSRDRKRIGKAPEPAAGTGTGI